MNALTGICLCNEVIPAPTITTGAEAEVNKAAQGQQIVADKEILQVQNAGALAQGLNVAPQVEAQHTGKGKQDNRNNVEANGLFAVPTG